MSLVIDQIVYFAWLNQLRNKRSRGLSNDLVLKGIRRMLLKRRKGWTISNIELCYVWNANIFVGCNDFITYVATSDCLYKQF